ncbi:NucA/NucB deoxyribonuclease domain-containing protein [Amycolatopsis circi]|uniref:NucA/NucB deoxyribonuclease domain-containing protein n=1 Tax=Amycolatopsis circi TaxID=871959 RepID=UPI0013BE8CA9|nr:NucA/NucB deoxyribonuclease domain-containing protein [Amycolatopsis circi]
MTALAGTVALSVNHAAAAQTALPPGSQIRVEITDLDGKPLQPGPAYPATAEGALAAAAAKGNEPSPEQATPEFRKAVAELADRPAGKPMLAGELPEFLLNLCKNDPRSESAAGHVFHRLFWCQRFGLKARAYRGTTLSGEVTLKWIAAAVGNYKIRTNTFWLQPTFAGDNWGDYGNALTTQLTVGPVCAAIGDPGCSTNYGPLTLPLEDWQRHVGIGQWTSWNIDSDETKSTALDKVSNHKWHITTGVHTPEPGNEWTADSPDNGMRCDSAPYFRYDPKSCISSDVIPWLPVYSGLLPEYAAHLRQALDAPDTTFPPEPHPKLIPGKYFYGDSTKPGLHRIPEGETGPNRAEKDKACPKIPTPHDPDEQCDEYPFASTMEGAASPVWDFSVKYIDGRQNGRGGNDLQALYQSSRILYKLQDTFYVNIIG